MKKHTLLLLASITTIAFAYFPRDHAAQIDKILFEAEEYHRAILENENAQEFDSQALALERNTKEQEFPAMAKEGNVSELKPISLPETVNLLWHGPTPEFDEMFGDD